MGDQEILEIRNLNDDDLLTVYDKVTEHIQYLQNSIIDTTVEEDVEVVEEVLEEGAKDE